MKKKAAPIETERLVLREIEEQDTEQIIYWRSNPAIYRYFVHAHSLTREEHLKWFYEEYLCNEKRIDWFCCIKETKMAAGVFGIKRIEAEVLTAELSYLLDEKGRHRGYAQEALRALLAWGRQHWKVEMAVAEIHKENEASLRLIKNMGFKLREKKKDFLLYESDRWEGV